MVDMTLVRPLNKGRHSFWYQSIAYIWLPIGYHVLLFTKSRGQLELSSIQCCGISFHQHVQE